MTPTPLLASYRLLFGLNLRTSQAAEEQRGVDPERYRRWGFQTGIGKSNKRRLPSSVRPMTDGKRAWIACCTRDVAFVLPRALSLPPRSRSLAAWPSGRIFRFYRLGSGLYKVACILLVSSFVCRPVLTLPLPSLQLIALRRFLALAYWERVRVYADGE